MSPSRSVPIALVINHARSTNLKRTAHMPPLRQLLAAAPRPCDNTIWSADVRRGWCANPAEARQSHFLYSWRASPGWAGTDTRPKPRMSATNRNGTAYSSRNSLFVLPEMRRLFELGAVRAPPRCPSCVGSLATPGPTLNCVCSLTSSNVGNRKPGCCRASTMCFFTHIHNFFGFGS